MRKALGIGVETPQRSMSEKLNELHPKSLNETLRLIGLIQNGLRALRSFLL
ncbi:hypothetical protein [Labilibaculum filiforme]|uniref:hypothetical protein n=1 Tax=Labilibaculum filiforme TaxID=1940526 RepID=UPI0015D60FE5|nr:hypothetical protein [Labilibaculum filiforme]